MNDKKLSPAAKLEMILALLGGKDTCPTCGHETETAPLISKEDAKKLLEEG